MKTWFVMARRKPEQLRRIALLHTDLKSKRGLKAARSMLQTARDLLSEQLRFPRPALRSGSIR
jgi:hypothetical protein